MQPIYAYDLKLQDQYFSFTVDDEVYAIPFGKKNRKMISNEKQIEEINKFAHDHSGVIFDEIFSLYILEPKQRIRTIMNVIIDKCYFIGINKNLHANSLQVTYNCMLSHRGLVIHRVSYDITSLIP